MIGNPREVLLSGMPVVDIDIVAHAAPIWPDEPVRLIPTNDDASTLIVSLDMGPRGYMKIGEKGPSRGEATRPLMGAVQALHGGHCRLNCARLIPR